MSLALEKHQNQISLEGNKMVKPKITRTKIPIKFKAKGKTISFTAKKIKFK